MSGGGFMENWINLTLGSPAFSVTVLLAALLLGLFAAVSSCCNLVVIGALAGYSGAASEKRVDRTILLGGLSFMLGTIIALATLGAVTGFVSQTVGSTLGAYWRLFAGAIMVFFGLASLNLLPIKLPDFGPRTGVIPNGTLRALIYGLAIGGGTTACSVGCNPVLPVALGVATLQGHTMWGATILGSFAVGYSLPLAGGIIGLSLGLNKLSAVIQKLAPLIKASAGIILIGAGLFLLATA
jgi:cytochrome c biogenesis protein CcdA